MAFDLVRLQDNITAYLQALLPNTPVIEDSLPDDVQIPRDAQDQMIPYIILRYSPLRERAYGGSIAGARDGDYYGNVDVMTAAPAGRMARQLLDVVSDALIGFDAGDGGETTLEGGASQFVVSSNEVRPTQFVCTVRMRFVVNGKNVAAPLVPTP
jgi:hypothetical protein